MDLIKNKNEWEQEFKNLQNAGYSAEDIAKKYNIKINSVRYYQHKSKYKEHRKANYKRYYNKYKEIPKEKMQECRNKFGAKCCICNFNKIQSALHFHHIDANQKEYGISRLVKSYKFEKELDAELNKCILVCANCHAGIHSGEITIPYN